MRFENAVQKIKLAHERRWGKSTLPIRVVDVLTSDPHAWSFDDENGSACKWDYSAHRIRRIDEKEPSF